MMDTEEVKKMMNNSADKEPRGFPEFDKLQLDPVRREYMTKLRIQMLDFNEEYLAKHPQVEAIVRLILMEVLCHKPFDVRRFIRNLLQSDSLESRVAKIILSKRINLDYAHTQEYLKHVAEWENKDVDGSNDEDEVEESVWPEPRPYREDTRRKKKEYCHLHYFKDPYWLYPTEMGRKKDPSRKENGRRLHRLPKWKSDYLKKDFFSKWGNPLEEPIEIETDEKLVSDERLKNNYQLISECPTCKKVVLGITDDSVPRLSSVTPKVLSATNPGGPTEVSELGDLAHDLACEWKKAKRIKVYRRKVDGEKLLFDEYGEQLATVKRVLLPKTGWAPKKVASCLPSWRVVPDGEEIQYVVPVKELEKVKSGTSKNVWDVPESLKKPLYQVHIPTSPTQVDETPIIKEEIPVTDLSGRNIRESEVIRKGNVIIDKSVDDSSADLRGEIGYLLKVPIYEDGQLIGISEVNYTRKISDQKRSTMLSVGYKQPFFATKLCVQDKAEVTVETGALTVEDQEKYNLYSSSSDDHVITKLSPLPDLQP